MYPEQAGAALSKGRQDQNDAPTANMISMNLSAFMLSQMTAGTGSPRSNDLGRARTASHPVTSSRERMAARSGRVGGGAESIGPWTISVKTRTYYLLISPGRLLADSWQVLRSLGRLVHLPVRCRCRHRPYCCSGRPPPPQKKGF